MKVKKKTIKRAKMIKLKNQGNNRQKCNKKHKKGQKMEINWDGKHQKNPEK